MISLVVPIFNDGYLAKYFLERLIDVFKDHIGSSNLEIHTELIFVNDGSSDDSISKLFDLSKEYNWVKVVDLSRNFGQHIAVTAGYKFAKGEYIGMMNVDLQEDISEFIKLVDFLKLNSKYDFAIGLREERKGTFLDTISSFLFNKLFNYLTGNVASAKTSTVRAMSRKFLDAYLEFTEKDRYLPAMENWLGFKTAYLPVKHSERKKGHSSYNLSRRVKMAIDAIVTFSDKPIKFAAILGFIVTTIGFTMMIRIIFIKIFNTGLQPGYTSIFASIIFFSGLQLLFLGLISIYIGKILKEVQNRPLFVVKNTYNL